MCQSHWSNAHKNKLNIKRGQFYILSLEICMEEKTHIRGNYFMCTDLHSAASSPFQFFWNSIVRVSVVFFFSFTIRVPGFGAVVMDLNFICQCECEKPSMAVS